MTTKCCGTCDKYPYCTSEDYCTRAPDSKIPEEKREVSYKTAGLRGRWDMWEEGKSKSNLLYRIKEIEKKLVGL